MIICGRGKRGNDLANIVIHELRKHGVAEVAALSESAQVHVTKIGQTVATAMKSKVNMLPRNDEVRVAWGDYRLGVVFKFYTQQYADEHPEEFEQVEQPVGDGTFAV